MSFAQSPFAQAQQQQQQQQPPQHQPAQQQFGMAQNNMAAAVAAALQSGQIPPQLQGLTQQQIRQLLTQGLSAASQGQQHPPPQQQQNQQGIHANMQQSQQQQQQQQQQQPQQHHQMAHSQMNNGQPNNSGMPAWFAQMQAHQNHAQGNGSGVGLPAGMQPHPSQQQFQQPNQAHGSPMQSSPAMQHVAPSRPPFPAQQPHQPPGGLVSGAQAAASAAQAAAMNRQQAASNANATNASVAGANAPGMGAVRPQMGLAGMPPALQHAIARAKNGQLDPTTLQKLRSAISSWQQGQQQRSTQQGLGQQSAPFVSHGQVPPQPRPPPATQPQQAQPQMPMPGSQHHTPHMNHAQPQPQMGTPTMSHSSPAQQSGLQHLQGPIGNQTHVLRPPGGAIGQNAAIHPPQAPTDAESNDLMRLLSVAQNRIRDLEPKLAAADTPQAREHFEKQMNDSKALLQKVLSLRQEQIHRQQQQQQQPGQSTIAVPRHPPQPGAQGQQNQPGVGGDSSIRPQPVAHNQAPGNQQTSSAPGGMVMKPENFMRALLEIHAKQGSPQNAQVKIGNRALDMYRFYMLVQAHGGSKSVSSKNAWSEIATALDLPLQVHEHVAVWYRNSLLPIENMWLNATVSSIQQRLLQQLQAQSGPHAQPAALQMQANAQAVAHAQSQAQQTAQQALRHMAAQNASMNQGGPSHAQAPQVPQQPPQAPTQQQAGTPQRPPSAAASEIPQQLTPAQLAQIGLTQDQFTAMMRSGQGQQLRERFLQMQQQRQQQNASGALAASAAAMKPPGAPVPQAQNASQMPPHMQARPPGFGDASQQHGQYQPQGQPPLHTAKQDGNSGMVWIANAPGSGPQPGQGGPHEVRELRVSEADLSKAKEVMMRMDQELSRSRPRLEVKELAEAEKESIFSHVVSLGDICDQVNALLPAFFAINRNIDAARRLKIMSFMFKDQLDLVPRRQCLLSLGDLEKLKTQIHRCISFVKTSAPALAEHLLSSMQAEREQSRASAHWQALQAQQQLQQQPNQPSTMPPALGQQPIGQPQHAQPPPLAPAPTAPIQNIAPAAPDAPDSDEALASMHGIKRGLRVEDLKPPPVKRGKATAATAQQNAPAAAQAKSPAAGRLGQLNNAESPGPSKVDSPKASAASPPAAKGGKKASAAKGKAARKTKAEKEKNDEATATAARSKPKTSADIMAEVKREMAEAEAKRKGEAGGVDVDGNVAPSQKPEDGTIQPPLSKPLTQRERDDMLAQQDPAAFVDAAWQDLVAPNGSGAGTSVPLADAQSLEGLLAMLGQEPGPGGAFVDTALPATDANANAASAASEAPPQPEANIEVDMFDWIDESYLDEPQAELSAFLGGGAPHVTREEPPAQTPDLVPSSKLPSGSSSNSSSMIMAKGSSNLSNTINALDGVVRISSSPSGMDSSDDSEPSPEDLINSITGAAGGSNDEAGRRASQKRKSEEDWWDTEHQPQLQPWAIVS
ncbi:swi snf complex subunit sol1 [Ceraceosorus bombacis]|uniref:Swi snf complex subunit sol1 n=1 Tax=Ceraceosorus bombacis TaxID=401625 RepID=A0A0N7L934_9BASI|nr:swi snf complex subunit sol1 [Ceraceosorus bombacis]